MILSQVFILLAVALAVVVCVRLALGVADGFQALVAAGRVERREKELFELRLRTAKRRQEQQEGAPPWNGVRKFKIDRMETECEGVRSFYLVPHDQKLLPDFRPGQYLTFELDIPGQPGRVVRCYSLSDRPRPDFYRVTIKRIAAPAEPPGGRPGLVSDFFHSRLKPGDILDVKAPAGGFYLELEQNTPVVLLGGGVGLTPLMSMLAELTTRAPGREVWLFLAVRNGSEHLMKAALENLARAHEQVRLRILYSRPRPGDEAGRDYQLAGRLTMARLREELPSNNYAFYLCGPGDLMSDLKTGLREWGVPEKFIHLEAFGPASVKSSEPAVAPGPAGAAWNVGFARSQKTAGWNGQADSLLDLALAEKVPVGYGCRAGNCGTCKTAVKSGRVRHLKEPGCELEAGSCLMCIGVPESDVVLEA